MSAPAPIAAAIPAYQAAPFVGDVIRRTMELLPDVLVVDDGSTDGTAEVAREAGALVMSHGKNRGKGKALSTAFGQLFRQGHRAVVTLDADGQHVPEQIPLLVEAFRQGADLVLGCRDRLFGEMGRVRRNSNRVSSRLISAVAGRRLNDVQCGFRLYTERVLGATGFPEPRYEAESAVVVRAARMGFLITAVPITLGYTDGRSTSHYRPVIDSLRIAAAVTRARLETVGWTNPGSSS